MTPYLLIFIDSLPFDLLPETPFLNSLPVKSRIIPGIGYSDTCQTELFSGRSPDDMGYFGSWTFSPFGSPFYFCRQPFNLLGKVNRFYKLDRLLHRILLKLSGLPIKNIPLHYLSYFSYPYVSVFDKYFPFDSILKLNNTVGIYSQSFSNMPWSRVDQHVYFQARQKIPCLSHNKHLFISMTKLDATGHIYGLNSHEYQNKIRELDGWIQDIYEQFTHRFSKAGLIVLSDHGMVDVSQIINLQLEKRFGKPNLKRYVYFLDGTLLRVWVKDTSLQQELEDYLDNLPIGNRLTNADRETFGVASKGFADIIYLINESLMFVPSFWGNRASKAMHGYFPTNHSQHGILILSDNNNPYGILPKTLRSTRVYTILKSLLCQ